MRIFLHHIHCSLALSDFSDERRRSIPQIPLPSYFTTDFDRIRHSRLYALAFYSLGVSPYRNDHRSLRRQYNRRYQMYPHGDPLQGSKNEFKHILHPNAVLPVRVNKQVISPSIQSTVLAFTFLYAVISIISILIMMGLGVGFLESIGTVISSMGNMGPGLGTCGPAFSWSELPDAAKWLLSFLMLLGRLELFTVLLLFTSDFWKKN